MARIYAPVSADDVAELLSAAQFRPAAAFGVTPNLTAVFAEEDEEGLEHLATQFAAAAATSDRVAVAVFDVADGASSPADSGDSSVPGTVTLASDLRHRDLVCFLVADPGERVSDDADLELSWYDAGELPAVRDLLRPVG